MNVTASEAERDLFDDASDGKLDRWTLGGAALLAAGVSDESRRSEYAKRLDALAAEARKAGAGAGGPLDRGDKLLRWLHDGPLAKGYAGKQSSLAVVLDEGTFNCVSSAVLFNDLARRLGLDARAVEVPDHAFSIVYHDGRHADVETTTARGFNPARDPQAVKEFHGKTGFVYLPTATATSGARPATPGWPR